MSLICPTVLAHDTDDYRGQLSIVQGFGHRIQIDLADGVFAPLTVLPDEIFLPEYILSDIHLMYRHPARVIDKLISLNPHMIILHVEAADELRPVIAAVKNAGIKVGLAVLQETMVASLEEYRHVVDHVLIFSGSLGRFGGVADLSLLAKVPQIRALNERIEIGWDGGVSSENARHLADGGVDVLNVGGYIQKARVPLNAYRQLENSILS